MFTNYNDISKQTAAWAIAHREVDIENSLPGNHVVALAVHGRPGKVNDAFVAGNYAYLAHDSEGLVVVNLTDPDNPVEAGNLSTNGKAQAVYIDGNYAYIANYLNGLVIADISNPAHPVIEASRATSGRAVNVCVSGDYTFVANGVFGLQIYPSDPDSLGNSDYPYVFGNLGGISDVYIDGNYAYIAAGSNGLGIVDFSNPDSLQLVGRYDDDTMTILAKEVVVHDSVAYIADASLGLLAIDVSDPADPTLIDMIDTPGKARSVTYSDTRNRVFVTDETDLRAFALSSPGDTLVYINGITTPGVALNVMVLDSTAYVADNYFGMQLIDISDPDTLIIASNFAPVCSTYIWAACRAGVGEDGQRYAVAYSPNYGQTWKTVIEEPAWDFAFIGDTVVVATDNGLYVSDDYEDWHVITEMSEENAHGDIVRPLGILRARIGRVRPVGRRRGRHRLYRASDFR